MQVADTREEQVAALLRYQQELSAELEAILAYWNNHTRDEKGGGFYGSVNNENTPDLTAPKGIVLNSRICWAFAAAVNHTGNKAWLEPATRAFEYILHHFIDPEYGGVYWSVNAAGNMLEGKKQIYGLAFCIYGMAEYYKASANGMALHVAKDLYDYIERYSHDREKGGYIEAFTRDWQTSGDLRLSDKDDNEKKTMNTHLHILEAYANLYQVWPDSVLREKIISLLAIFDQYLINKKDHHLHLFLDDDWQVKSSLQSFGHDIEAAWLLQECAAIVNDSHYISQFKTTAILLADAAATGLDKDGGLWYEYEPATSYWIREKHSWPQAEAMVGFFNAWQLTNEEKYLRYSLNSWEFIKNHIRDTRQGEWFWGVKEDYTVMQKDKAGFWKCPYHNARACMEIMRRINI